VIALDTNIIIYWLEDNTEYTALVKKLVMPVLAQEEYAVVSVALCTEFVAGSGSSKLLNPLLLLPNISVKDVSYSIAMLAGELCKSHKLKHLDAIHLATAIESGASKFITNDQQLLKLREINKLKIVGLK